MCTIYTIVCVCVWVCERCFYVDRQHLWQSQSVSDTSSTSAHSKWNHKWHRSHWTHSSMASSPEPGGTTLRQRVQCSPSSVGGGACFFCLLASWACLFSSSFAISSLRFLFFYSFSFSSVSFSTSRLKYSSLVMTRAGNGMRRLTFSFLSRAGLMRKLARLSGITPAATR